jgi:hypothetical protein
VDKSRLLTGIHRQLLISICLLGKVGISISLLKTSSEATFPKPSEKDHKVDTLLRNPAPFTFRLSACVIIDTGIGSFHIAISETKQDVKDFCEEFFDSAAVASACGSVLQQSRDWFKQQCIILGSSSSDTDDGNTLLRNPAPFTFRFSACVIIDTGIGSFQIAISSISPTNISASVNKCLSEVVDGFQDKTFTIYSTDPITMQSGSETITTSISPGINEWNQLIITMDGENNQMHLYHYGSNASMTYQIISEKDHKVDTLLRNPGPFTFRLSACVIIDTGIGSFQIAISSISPTNISASVSCSLSLW